VRPRGHDKTASDPVASRLMLNGGIRIRVDDDVNLAALRRVLTALRG
jgi:hypothetical protein